MKGNSYWRYTHFPLNRDYGREGKKTGGSFPVKTSIHVHLGCPERRSSFRYSSSSNWLAAPQSNQWQWMENIHSTLNGKDFSQKHLQKIKVKKKLENQNLEVLEIISMKKKKDSEFEKFDSSKPFFDDQDDSSTFASCRNPRGPPAAATRRSWKFAVFDFPLGRGSVDFLLVFVGVTILGNQKKLRNNMVEHHGTKCG